MLGPGGEAVLVERELRLEVLDDVLVLEEEDGTVAVREAVDPRLSRGELLRRDDLLQDVHGDVPELLVVVTEQENSL